MLFHIYAEKLCGNVLSRKQRFSQVASASILVMLKRGEAPPIGEKPLDNICFSVQLSALIFYLYYEHDLSSGSCG